MRRNSCIVDCLGIAIAAAVIAALLRPFQNTPFVDDWAYAWPVEHLLKTGELKILDWATSLNIAQILWGALFSLPFGFSFTALRISTFVLSVSGLCGFYLLLMELGVTRRDALLGTALMGAYPVYFLLSFTFMTDVPFVVVTIWFCLCAVKAFRVRQTRWLGAAATLAIVATAIRLTGVALALVLLAVLLFNSGRWGRNLG